MKRSVIISILMIVFAVKSYSQVDTSRGIHFVQNLTWQEILQKAKVENKFIFVDCYATWCGPCKWMDKLVYPNDSVGAFLNDRFISVKVQMDTAKNDNEEIQRWYGSARMLLEQYHIDAYPCFLFFAPDGRVLHKALGGQNIPGFLILARTALDSNRQYYTLLNNYRHGDKNYAKMAVLADDASILQQYNLAAQVAVDYVQQYLELLPRERLWWDDNILFVNHHSEVIHFREGIFNSYYRDRKLIDSIMKESGFSDRLINDVIYRDYVKLEIDKALQSGNEPNWHQMEEDIARNCDSYYAKKNVLQGRVEYYQTKKNWIKYTNYFIREMEENGIETWSISAVHESYLNNAAFEVFQHSNDKRQLEKALSWIERSIAMAPRPDPQEMDTKANLLYKLGRKREGLALEQQSHDLDPKDREIAASYEKMKKGLPTWKVE